MIYTSLNSQYFLDFKFIGPYLQTTKTQKCDEIVSESYSQCIVRVTSFPPSFFTDIKQFFIPLSFSSDNSL